MESVHLYDSVFDMFRSYVSPRTSSPAPPLRPPPRRQIAAAAARSEQLQPSVALDEYGHVPVARHCVAIDSSRSTPRQPRRHGDTVDSTLPMCGPRRSSSTGMIRGASPPERANEMSIGHPSHHICTQGAQDSDGLSERWVIVGPVRSCTDVDPSRFTFCVEVRAPVSLTGREVFARCVPKLTRSGWACFGSSVEAHESLRFLALRPCTDPVGEGRVEPSWRGLERSTDLTVTDCRRLLDRAARVAGEVHRTAEGRSVRGDVTVKRRLDLNQHAWVRYFTRLRDRRYIVRGAQAVRQAASFDAMPLERQLGVLAAANGATSARYRAALELTPPGQNAAEGALAAASHATAADGEPDPTQEISHRDAPARGAHSSGNVGRPVRPRASRRSLAYNTSVPKMLPTPAARAMLIRKAVDHPDRAGHSMLTLSESGAVRVWNYILGSATEGMRWYRGEDGTRKRLAAPHLRRRRKTRRTGEAADGVSPEGAPTTARGDPTPPSLDTDELVSLFHVPRTTHLERIDGSEREIVWGIEYDVAHGVQRALDLDGIPSSAVDVLQAVNDVTLAGDGGPVRRRTLTVFTISLSSSLLRSGRTPMFPVLFLLCGENFIHSALADRLRFRVNAVLSAQYAAPAAGGGSVPLRLPYRVRLCSDFAMLGHFLSISGGIHRCPGRWPCALMDYLSLLAQEHTRGAPRDPGILSRLWEMAVWALWRWCALFRGPWTAVGGRMTATCICGSLLVATSNPPAVLTCGNPSCARQPMRRGRREGCATLLPSIACSPLSTFFSRVRRAFGGTRGYPLLRDIPFMVQLPILHCTGKIAKSLIFFMFALLPETLRETARRNVYSVMGRSNIGGLYLREFGRLVGHLIAVPQVLGVPIDEAVLVMLKLSQILTACWRRAVSTAPADERECAAATLQLVASLLAPLYAHLKPYDPQTKDAGVFNLYLHTAVAHVRDTVGKDFPTAKHVCDDNIEGKISELNRYVKTRTNNVSLGESLVNKEAIEPMKFNKTAGRMAVECMIYTKKISLCSCVYLLGQSVRADVMAATRLAGDDSPLTVSIAHDNSETLTPGTAAVIFSLPESIVDEPKVVPEADANFAFSAEMELHNALSACQTHVAICTCGLLMSKPGSALAAKATADAAVNVREGLPVGQRQDNDAATHPVPSTTQEEATQQGAHLANTEQEMRTSGDGEEEPQKEGGRGHDTAGDLLTLQHDVGFDSLHRPQGADVANTDEGISSSSDDDEEPQEADNITAAGRLFTLNHHADSDGMDSDAAEDSNRVDDVEPAHDAPSTPSTRYHPSSPAAFLMSSALGYSDVAPFLPPDDVVNCVFNPIQEYTTEEQARLLSVRHKMEEDMVMIDWLYQRLQTSSFGAWLMRDGVNVRDVLRAMETMKSRMHDRVASLLGGGIQVGVMQV